MGVVKSVYPCLLTLAMDIVGGKWKMVILWHLRKGTLRFNELRRLLDGITQKMLTQQLRDLEESRLITRTVYAVVPPKVEYSLTEEGRNLVPVLDSLCQWSSVYAKTHHIAQTSCCPSLHREQIL